MSSTVAQILFMLARLSGVMNAHLAACAGTRHFCVANRDDYSSFVADTIAIVCRGTESDIGTSSRSMIHRHLDLADTRMNQFLIPE